LTGTRVGSCTVTATKAADANFNAAATTVDVTVTRAEQAPLTATASPATIVFGSTSLLGTTGGSGTGAVSYAVTAGSANCSITSGTLTGTGAGNCTVTATKAADANFNAATATINVAVTRADQAPLTAISSPSTIVLTGTSTLGTTGGSGTGAVSYAVTAGAANCSVSGSTLTGTSVGNCTVTATKAADANYNAATATVPVIVLAGTDLQVSIDNRRNSLSPDGLVEYEILIANAGPLDVQGARLVNAVPAGLSDVLWSCTAVQLAACPDAAGVGGINQSANLPVNGVLRYVLSARVNATLGATVTSVATISVPPGVSELRPVDNTAVDADPVLPDLLLRDGFEPAPQSISVPY
jgi:uncharacterized repeat protein (TIGR01451 family)